jgi:hypothetical protein
LSWKLVWLISFSKLSAALHFAHGVGAGSLNFCMTSI